MANKFISWLENIPAELKKFFTSPVVAAVAEGGLNIVGLIDPALLPLTTGIAAAVVKAESLAAAANLQNGTGTQKLALAVADAQAVFQAYEQQTGVTIETAQQTAIVNAIVALLNSIPTASTTTATPVTSVIEVPAATPSVQAQVKSNDLL
jgi:hypothetical protein